MMPIKPTFDGPEDEHEPPRPEPDQDVIDLVVELEKHLAFAYPVNLGPPEVALVRYVTWDRGPISFLATHNLGPDWDNDRIERACKRAVMMFKLVLPVWPESTVPKHVTALWSHVTLTEAGYALADKTLRATDPNTGDRRSKPKQRRHKRDAGNRLKGVAAKDFVHDYIREECGGKWRGTLTKLREALNQHKRIDRGESSLYRDLKGTKLWEPPNRSAPHKTLRGKGEHEAVSSDGGVDDPSGLSAYTMPDD